jgi:superfamily II DNA or RNA helicase
MTKSFQNFRKKNNNLSTVELVKKWGKLTTDQKNKYESSSPKKKSSSPKKKSSSPKKKSSSPKKKSSSPKKKSSSEKKSYKRKSLTSHRKKKKHIFYDSEECPEGQEKSKITGKCIDKCPEDKERAIKSDSCVKKCPSHQVRNKITGKCVNRKDLTPKKKEFVKCKPYQYRDPKTNKCVTLLNPNAHIVLAEDEEIVGKCIERSKVLLRPIQQKIIEYMKKNDAILVEHGVGCGKTLTSIGTSECFLDRGDKKGEDRNIVVICPAGLIVNYKKEMQKYGVKKKHALKYSFYSFDKVLSIYKSKDGTINCDRNKTLLIIDEVHNLRNPSGSKFRAVFYLGVINSKKRLLLSATPFVNSTNDFINIINILYGRYLVAKKDKGTTIDCFEIKDKDMNSGEIKTDNIYKILNYLNQKIDIQDCIDKNFPKNNETFINDITMSGEFYRRYIKLLDKYNKESIDSIIFNSPEKFYNGYRRAVNYVGGEYITKKLERSIPIIKTGKTFIFSNWLEFGTNVVSRILEKNGIRNYENIDDIDTPKYAFITGKVKTDERYAIIDQYNSNDPTVNKNLNTLIISRAGGEGIDLKNVRNVIILDPAWNNANLHQVIGRAIRYKSHIDLPENERIVNIYKMILKCPDNDEISGDEILYSIINYKSQVYDKLYEILDKNNCSILNTSKVHDNEYVKEQILKSEIVYNKIYEKIQEQSKIYQDSDNIENIIFNIFGIKLREITKKYALDFLFKSRIIIRTFNLDNYIDLENFIIMLEKKCSKFSYYKDNKDNEEVNEEEEEEEDEEEEEEDEEEYEEDEEDVNDEDVNEEEVNEEEVNEEDVNEEEVNEEEVNEEEEDANEEDVNEVKKPKKVKSKTPSPVKKPKKQKKVKAKSKTPSPVKKPKKQKKVKAKSKTPSPVKKPKKQKKLSSSSSVRSNSSSPVKKLNKTQIISAFQNFKKNNSHLGYDIHKKWFTMSDSEKFKYL